MLRLKPRPCPLDYRHCDQTVTVYHADAADRRVTRTVLHGAHLDPHRVQTVDKTGSTAGTGFLLVIPERAAAFGSGYTLAAQDKVLRGEGPTVSYEEWGKFIPALVEGVCVVKYVDEKYWGGARCHVEAGG